MQAEPGLEQKGRTPYLSKQDELPSLKSRHYGTNLLHFKAMRSFHLAYARVLTLTNSKRNPNTTPTARSNAWMATERVDVCVIEDAVSVTQRTHQRRSKCCTLPVNTARSSHEQTCIPLCRPFSTDELALFGRVVLTAATPESKTVTEGLPFRSADAVVRCSELRSITLRVCAQHYRNGQRARGPLTT